MTYTNDWPRAVVFDLDGTLIESLPDIHASANKMLADLGLAPLSMETVKGFVGKGSRILAEKTLRYHGLEPDAAAIDGALRSFLAHYDEAPIATSYVYPGVTEVLRTLKDEGRRLAVCTNKQKSTTINVLDGFGLAPYFDVVMGGDEAPHRKPDPRHILDVLAKLGVSAADAVMVGDSENDIEAAQGANVKTVAVSFGYCHKPLAELAPDAVVDTFADVTEAIRSLAA